MALILGFPPSADTTQEGSFNKDVVQRLLLELSIAHTGQNIASQIVEVLRAFEIGDEQIGLFTLDSVDNMDTMMDEIGDVFNFDGKKWRGRCFGHQISLSAKALVFGLDVEAFEAEISKAESLSAAEYRLYQKIDPAGKAHNLCVDIHHSDRLYYILLNIQVKDLEGSVNPNGRALCVASQRTLAKKPRVLREENRLTDRDWGVLEHTASILNFYEFTIKNLEGDGLQRKRRRGWTGSYGNIWEIVFGLSSCLGSLRNIRPFRNTLLPRTKEAGLIPVYYAGIALRSNLRWKWFHDHWGDQLDWVRTAKRLVRDPWDKDYRDLKVDEEVEDRPQKQQKTNPNPFEQYVQQQATRAPSFGIIEDEYEAWQVTPRDSGVEVDDPLAYWHARRFRYPRLSQMALDVLTVQSISAECERLFSAASQMTTPLRSQLDSLIIGMSQVLRSWFGAGIITDLDPVLQSTTENDEYTKISRIEDDQLKAWTTAWLYAKETERNEEDIDWVYLQDDEEQKIMAGSPYLRP
ncbi:hypothetical protein DL769_004913 [Monosporascus sp. CRB-8-3]|nr:hypothetical protein DL769_004913 [Monosporascus sp. CRB-8-3]